MKGESGSIPAFARDILQTLEGAGHEAYCVGGCVRDTLLGRTPGDWDITTSARPEETLALFGADALPTGLRHGTVTVRRPDGCAEVTTFRRDGDYTDHRHPESVAFTDSLTEDLARRDFTVNAMALSLRGELRDPFHGREDLAAGRIRCVGEPARRFGEDALRILRGLRFAAVLGFAIEPETAAALSAAREDLRAIAPERIFTEVRKLLAAERPSAVLREFPEVFGVFWPELLPMLGYDQRNFHHCYDLWEHTLHALDAVPGEEALRFAALFHDVGKPDCFSLDAGGVGHFYGHAAKSAQLADAMLARLRAPNAPERRSRSSSGGTTRPSPASRRRISGGSSAAWGRRGCGGSSRCSGRTTWLRLRNTGRSARRGWTRCCGGWTPSFGRTPASLCGSWR